MSADTLAATVPMIAAAIPPVSVTEHGAAALGQGLGATVMIIAVALLMHEPWRWAGLYLGRAIDVDSEVFQWVRSVATALVSGLVMRLILFPAGALAGPPLWLRLAAFVIGIVVFFRSGRSLTIGVASGAAMLIAGQLLLTGSH